MEREKDPLDFVRPHELERLFRSRKTELSCLENPQTILNQLRDHDLIPEDRYQKITRTKKTNARQEVIYEFLDWLEKEKPERIPSFWKCLFKRWILDMYPQLQILRDHLIDGSYHFDGQLPDRSLVKKEVEMKRLKEDEEKDEEKAAQSGCVKKKRKTSRSAGDGSEEKPGPSTPTTPSRSKSKKILYSPSASPKKGEKIWSWPIYRSQLPVTCGNKEGMLARDKLAKGEKSILAEERWFSPGQFEKFGGKGTSRNWKSSIRCNNTPLGKLIQWGELKVVPFKKTSKAVEQLPKPQSSGSEQEEEQVVSFRDAEDSTDESEGEVEQEEDTREQTETRPHWRKLTFKVTCGLMNGALDSRRFISGTRGKSIRTESSWMTPVEFVRAGTSKLDENWRKDIVYDGKPLSALIQTRTLMLHSLLCKCKICVQDPEEAENQKNDDECFICKSGGDLVVCDHCPRSFHQRCHLPYIEETIMRDDTKWMCTFCIFRTIQQSRYDDEHTTKVILNQRFHSHKVECHYLLMYLRAADEEQQFQINPEIYSGNDKRFARTSMCLSDIADKLQQNRYNTVGHFVSDVELIFTNCAVNNRENAEILGRGKSLKQIFYQEFKKVFNIHD